MAPSLFARPCWVAVHVGLPLSRARLAASSSLLAIDHLLSVCCEITLCKYHVMEPLDM
jgi:hypothetical protein